MKNLTLALDDESYRRARVKAAHVGRSLTSIVKDFLVDFATEETEFERLKRMEHELRAEMDAKGWGSILPKPFRARSFTTNASRGECLSRYEYIAVFGASFGQGCRQAG